MSIYWCRTHKREATCLGNDGKACCDPMLSGITAPCDVVSADKITGLYHKFNVTRTDGSSGIGGKHHDCRYFVLDLTHDKHARAAIAAYAASCAKEYPVLAQDLDKLLETEPFGYGLPD